MGIRRRKPIVQIIIALALIAGGVWWFTRKTAPQEVKIETAKVERGTITTSVSGTGILEPLTTVDVQSNVGGEIVALSVDEGDTVTAGQVLAKIDPTDAQSTLDQSRADLEGARSRVASAQSNLTIQQQQYPAQLVQAEKAVETAKLRLSQAEKTAKLTRAQVMASLDQAKESVNAAKARLAQAEDQARVQPQLTETNITQAKRSRDAAISALTQMKNATIPQQIASSQASLDQAQANLTYAEKDLKRQRDLVGQGFVAKSTLEASEQKYEVAKAAFTTAKQKMDTVREETRENLESAQAKLDQAEAALKSAEANRIQDNLKQQDAASARASLRQAESALKSAEANQVSISLKEDDVAAARTSLEQAIASRENVKATAGQTDIRKADITQASATVKRSEAALTNAEKSLGYTTISAPRGGVVVKKLIEVGSIVAPARASTAGSGAALVQIADVSRMLATVNIDETDIASISLRQEVEVTVDAYPDDIYIGTVKKIAPMTVTAQNVTTIPVTVEIEAPDLRLKPGMNATCDFITNRKQDVLTVPRSALKSGKGGMQVLVMADGKPTPRPVETGMSDGSNTEIVTGLKEGDTIVTAVHDPREDAANDRRSTSPMSPMGGPPMGGRRR